MSTFDNHSYLTASQVRERFGGISDMTLWRWLHRKELGFPKPTIISRRRYFRLTDIVEFEAKQEAKAEIRRLGTEAIIAWQRSIMIGAIRETVADLPAGWPDDE